MAAGLLMNIGQAPDERVHVGASLCTSLMYTFMWFDYNLVVFRVAASSVWVCCVLVSNR